MKSLSPKQKLNSDWKVYDEYMNRISSPRKDGIQYAIGTDRRPYIFYNGSMSEYSGDVFVLYAMDVASMLSKMKLRRTPMGAIACDSLGILICHSAASIMEKLGWLSGSSIHVPKAVDDIGRYFIYNNFHAIAALRTRIIREKLNA